MVMNREVLGCRLASNGGERESSTKLVFREGKRCETKRESLNWLSREVRGYCVIFMMSLCFFLLVFFAKDF